MFSWVSPGSLRRINWVYFLWCRHWCLATGENCRILFFFPLLHSLKFVRDFVKIHPNHLAHNRVRHCWRMTEKWTNIYCFITLCSPHAGGVRDNSPGWILLYNHNKGHSEAIREGCSNKSTLNSADLLVMRDFQSLTKEAYFWFSSHSPKRFVCAKERRVVLAGQCLCTAMPGKQVGSHHGTALESTHSWAAAFRDPLLQDGARVLVELLSPLFFLLQHGEPWRKSEFLSVCSLTGTPAQN